MNSLPVACFHLRQRGLCADLDGPADPWRSSRRIDFPAVFLVSSGGLLAHVRAFDLHTQLLAVIVAERLALRRGTPGGTTVRPRAGESSLAPVVDVRRAISNISLPPSKRTDSP